MIVSSCATIVPPQRRASPAARRAGASRWQFAAALAAALAVHGVLAFAVRLHTPAAPTPPRMIELELTTAAALFGSRAATLAPEPSAAAVALPAKTTGTVARAAIAGAAVAAPAAPAAAQPANAGVEPPRLLAGKSVAELVSGVASAAAPAASAAVRVQRLGHGTPQRADFAYYLNAWQRKVERIGELNYPREARAKGITGSLRLLVSIAPDGALRDAAVLETSGRRLLDDAALRIVHLAAPYAPFSPAMRDSTDLLEIERTWQFRRSRLVP